MHRIKLTIVATCAAVTAATITPAYAMDDVEPDTSTALSQGIKEYGLLKTAYLVLWDIVTFPVLLSLGPLIKPSMTPQF
mgnify:FL=1